MTKRILLIADNDAIRTTTELLLKSAGYEVTSCSCHIRDVAMAVRRIKSCDLVVLDHTLSRLDKEKIFNRVKKEYPNCPVLELCYLAPDLNFAEFHLADRSPENLLETVALIFPGKKKSHAASR